MQNTDNNDLKKLLAEFKKELLEELKESEFSNIYYDYEILENLSSYTRLSDLFSQDSSLKDKVEKIEKSILKVLGAIKLSNEQGAYFYIKRRGVYDSNGTLIEGNYEDYINEEDLFCEHIGDNIYELMEKNARYKLRNSYNEEM